MRCRDKRKHTPSLYRERERLIHDLINNLPSYSFKMLSFKTCSFLGFLNAQEAKRKMKDIRDEKLFTLHDIKSACLVIKGNKKIQQELEMKLLKLYGIDRQIVENPKYFGDNLAHSLSESVSMTVRKRLRMASLNI